MGGYDVKEFNVTGTCIPEENYMADITEKLERITEMVEKGQYFTINRARQYGKTTMLAALYRRLKNKYYMIRMSFESCSEESFENNGTFVKVFISLAADSLEVTDLNPEIVNEWSSLDLWEGKGEKSPFEYLSKKITSLCKKSDKEILLMIDEADKSSDNQSFLNFLGMLRNKYLRRREGLDVTFRSVILAGVYDIKNLKLKIRSDAEKKYNSPWNIAADFNVDMSFSPEEIGGMLSEYEKDHGTGMDILEISREIYFYTSGYPYLVSRLCKWIDEEGGRVWSTENVRKAECAVLNSENTLFDDLIKNIENDAELKRIVKDMLLNGLEVPFVQSNEIVKKGLLFGFFSRHENNVRIANIIFETYLYNHFLIEKLLENRRQTAI